MIVTYGEAVTLNVDVDVDRSGWLELVMFTIEGGCQSRYPTLDFLY